MSNCNILLTVATFTIYNLYRVVNIKQLLQNKLSYIENT